MKLPLLEASLDEVIDFFLFTQVTGEMIVVIEGLYQDIVFIYRHIVPDKGQRTSTTKKASLPVGEAGLSLGEATSPTRHLCVRMASMMDSPTRATLARR